jgi:hypothetical protein
VHLSGSGRAKLTISQFAPARPRGHPVRHPQVDPPLLRQGQGDPLSLLT